MNIDHILEHISQLEYPQQVDVVDAVMDSINAQPTPQTIRPLWRRFAPAVAAAATALVVAGIAIPLFHPFGGTGTSASPAQTVWSSVEHPAIDSSEVIINK